jgi:hypothetical protein
MNNAVSRVSVTMHQHGKPITAAAPGSTVELEVKVRQTHPGPLHYRWTSDSDGLVPADAPAVTMKLPATAGAAQVASPHVFAAHVSVEISNGKGGLLDLSIAVPVKTAASHEPSQFLGILGENGTLLGILDDNGMLFKILDDNGMLFKILDENGTL